MLDRKGLAGFLAISFGIAWVLAVPLLLDPRHLAAPWTKGVLAATMFAPAIATFVVTRWISPSTALRTETGLVLGRRWVRFWIFADLGMLFFVVGALVVGWTLGLLPKLLPLGQWRALLLSGPIWGAWHAPVVALGYNYPQHHALGPLLMIVFCVIFGILLGWSGWLLPLAFIAWLATTRRLPVATA